MTLNESRSMASFYAIAKKVGNRVGLWAILFTFVSTGVFVWPGTLVVHAQNPKTYFVDCADGNDTNPGTSVTQAWKSMAKANAAPLQPGDQLLFKRDCAWQGPLKAAWTGTATEPITIGAYGTGNLPRIQNSYSGNVQVSGKYQTIEYVEVTLTTPPNPDQNCNNQPVAWKVGFGFSNSAAYNTLQHSKASKLAVGVYLGNESHHNKVLHNTITDNNVAWELDSTHSIGAMGIMLKGDDHEIAHNYFANNQLICTYNGEIGGISIELYGARNANIHHNRSFNDRVFSEMGSSSAEVASDNVYAFNLHVVETQVSANFLITRGQGSTYGPVWRTKAYNNTVYLIGPNSKGVVCGFCGSDVLLLKNNILWADNQPMWTDGPVVEENNIFWSTSGSPLLNFTKSLSSSIADPGFTDLDSWNFHPVSSSLAIDAGSYESVSAGFNTDLDAVDVPQSSAVDIGAYELPAIGLPNPTPSPTPTPDQIASCSVTINDSALYSGNRLVQVTANVPGATQMIVSNDAGFAGATWQPYETEFDWTLRDTSSRIATLLVYVRFNDINGATLCGGAQISDDIIYDPVPPSLSVAIASASSADANTSNVQDTVEVLLTIEARDQDNGSGVESMQISLDETFSDSLWQPFAPTSTVNAEPDQAIFVRVRDGSGNVSPTATTYFPGADDFQADLYFPFIRR